MQTTDFATRFAPIVTAHRGGPFLVGDTRSTLSLHEAGRLSILWAPFDYVASEARLVVVGITPVAQQAENALRAFHAALQTRMAPAEASRLAKRTGAFSGPMREQLVAMLDHIGVHELLGLRSCEMLFAPEHDFVHLTSALRHPVFVDGANYNGTPDMLRTPVLRGMIEAHLAEEARALPHALWLPLGPKPAAALQHLAGLGLLRPERILSGLPHPSGANRERVSFFLGRKARGALSIKTRPDLIEAARDRLCAQIARMPAFG